MKIKFKERQKIIPTRMRDWNSSKNGKIIQLSHSPVFFSNKTFLLPNNFSSEIMQQYPAQHYCTAVLYSQLLIKCLLYCYSLMPCVKKFLNIMGAFSLFNPFFDWHKPMSAHSTLVFFFSFKFTNGWMGIKNKILDCQLCLEFNIFYLHYESYDIRNVFEI